jgi:putative transposase
MLGLIELNQIFERLGTPSKGRQLVEKARRESPVRKVQSNLGNVITLFNSKKMDRAIATESRRIEFPAVVQYEHDLAILEYYAQPCRIDIVLTDGGRIKPSRIQHTPDFLLIRENEIVLEEWKEESSLIKLANKYPGRFVRDDGGWHYPEVEVQLAEMGITYRLRSGDEHSWVLVSNLNFLADYLSPACPPVEKLKIKTIQDAFADKAVLNLQELLSVVGCSFSSAPNTQEYDEGLGASSLVTTDDIYKAIADKQIVFDLAHDDISDTLKAKVYRDEISLQFYRTIEVSSEAETMCRLGASIKTGADVEYEGITYRIDLVGQKSVMLSGENGTTELSIDLLQKQYLEGKLTIRSNVAIEQRDEEQNSIGPKAMGKALERWEQIELSMLSPQSVMKSNRTIQRYRKKIREAGDSAIDQLISLVPNTKNCGRARKIPQELVDLIKKVVEKYNNPNNINKNTAYIKLKEACYINEIKSCSKVTFNKEVDRLKSDRKRKGKRFAYQNEPIVWYLKLEEHVHGVRPFQIVHIDHTPLDLLIKLPKSNIKLKAYLSLAIDAESRRVVGFYLSFEPPSYKSCMMVLRDIVRRHGRMPEMIIVDNGKEFHSRAFKRVVRAYGGHLRYRPSAKPRHGSVLERLFGTLNTQVIHNLQGNTQLMKHVRTVTKSVNPGNFVEWTLPALHAGLDYFFELLYGTEPHPAHGEEPVKHFNERMIQTGMRLHRLVRYDRMFRIETCPPPEGVTRIVDHQRGVKINHIWYWSDVFRGAKLDGKPVEVRIDPWDVRVVYVLVKNQWHKCVSKLFWLLRQYSEIELRYAFEELAKEYGIQKKELTPERVAEWLKVLDARNFDPRLQETQSEARLVYEPLGMTEVDQLTSEQTTNHKATAANSGQSNIPNESKLLPEDESIINQSGDEYELF